MTFDLMTFYDFCVSVQISNLHEGSFVALLGTRRWNRATEDYFIYFMNKGELVSLSPTLSIFWIPLRQ